MMMTKSSHPLERCESRIPMEIPVLLNGHGKVPGAESTFTENVSVKGARVVTTRRWDKGARLLFVLRTGEFRSQARVAYCLPIRGDGYAIGLQFLEPKGRWVVESSN